MSAKHRHYRHHCYAANRGCLGQFSGLCSCSCALCRAMRNKIAKKDALVKARAWRRRKSRKKPPTEGK